MNGLIAKRETEFVETEIDGEAVVMSLASGDFFSLKDTALAIWQAIDGKTGRAALIAALAADYGVAEAAIASEVGDFIERAKAAGLVDEG